MGKHFWAKRSDDESRSTQPGCIWGLPHVLDFHHWQSNVKKMIHHRRYDGRTPDRWSVDCDDGYQKLLDDQESTHHGAKTSRGSKKRSRRARVKAVFDEGEEGLATKSSLQKTYSIHHLESVDDFFGKIRSDWNHPIIFLPRNAENCPSQSSDADQTEAADGLEGIIHSPKDAAEIASKEKHNVYEIFKVDKEVFLKHLQDSDEGIASLSRSSFGLKTKGKFSKSRSFPVADLAQRKKLKPLKLESKQQEVWSLPKDGKSKPLADESNDILSQGIMKKLDKNGRSSESLEYGEGNSEVDRKEDGVKKHTHSRSSSLNESVDKYARLFENNFGKDVKLSSSQSLKLTSEYGNAPLYFKRRRSLSNTDSYYSDINLKILGDDNPSGASLVVIAEYSSSAPQNTEEEEAVNVVTSHVGVKEDDTNLRLHSSNDKESLEVETDQVKESDSHLERDGDCSNSTLKEDQDPIFVLNSDTLLQDTEAPQLEIHFSQGEEHNSTTHKLDSLTPIDDLQCGEEVPSISQNLETYDKDEETTHPCKKATDLDYVKHLLVKSGIAIDASEMAWHSSDQLLSPQLFEEVEAEWPHEEDEFNGWPDFEGCWHHQMLFDLVNEVLLEVYDISVPYYPKALSSNCHVRPFPMGDRIVEEVCKSVGTLMDVKTEEEEDLIDCVVARDLARDRRWMNLQLESESLALYLEDVIFDELLQEVMFS